MSYNKKIDFYNIVSILLPFFQLIDIITTMKPLKLLWDAGDQKGHLFIMREQNNTVMHTHNFDELVFVLSGTGVHVIGKEKYPLIPGDVFVVKAGQIHKFEKTKSLHIVNLEYKWDAHYIHLEKDYSTLTALKTLFVHEPHYRTPKKFDAKLHLSPWQIEEIVNLLEIIKTEEKNKRPGYNSIIENIFKTIIIKVCRFYTETSSPAPKNMLKIGAVIDFISEHYQEIITRDQLANIADMPLGTFCRVFKETTGMSPINYLIRFRIEKAAEMIDETDKLKIIDVAMSNGFDSSAYFSKKFKDIIGLTPLAFKKQRPAKSLN